MLLLVVVATIGCQQIFGSDPTHLVFLSQPTGTLVATAAQPEIRVAFVDDDGDLITGIGDSVILSVAGGNVAARTSGTLRAKAIGGVATFDPRVLSAGTGFRFEATTARFPTAFASHPFDVAPGPAVSVDFARTDPTAPGIWVGAPTPFTARIVDAQSNVVPSSMATITLTSAAPLRGTTTAATSAGVAQFPDLEICASGITARLSGTTVNISVQVTGLPSSTVAIDVYAGTATRLVWVREPTSARAGAKMSDFAVEARDCGDNPVYGGLILGWGACIPALEPNVYGASVVKATADGGALMSSSWATGFNLNTAVNVPGNDLRMTVTCTGPKRDQPGSVTVVSPPSAPFDVLP